MLSSPSKMDILACVASKDSSENSTSSDRQRMNNVSWLNTEISAERSSDDIPANLDPRT